LVDKLADAITNLSTDKELREKLIRNATIESKSWTKKTYYEDFLNAIK
jgi:hypothetical protein